MKIDSYSFGEMIIDGKSYDNDLIVYPDKIEPGWWREQGHSLSLHDLRSVLSYEPDYLIIGCGAQSQMHIPQETKVELEKKGIKVLFGPTKEMYKVFNRHIQEGKKAVAAFHLTC